MLLTLAGILALAGFDAGFTYRQFKKFGPKIELNNLVRWLATHVGYWQAVLAGVLVPASAGCALFYAFGMEKLALIVLGMRTTLFLHQLKFLSTFEKKVELLNSSHDLHSRGPGSSGNRD